MCVSVLSEDEQKERGLMYKDVILDVYINKYIVYMFVCIVIKLPEKMCCVKENGMGGKVI